MNKFKKWVQKKEVLLKYLIMNLNIVNKKIILDFLSKVWYYLIHKQMRKTEYYKFYRKSMVDENR